MVQFDNEYCMHKYCSNFIIIIIIIIIIDY